MSKEDILIFLEYFFTRENPLSINNFTDNFNLFKLNITNECFNGMLCNELENPFIICKICFTNKINSKDGLSHFISLLSLSFKTKNDNSFSNKKIKSNEKGISLYQIDLSQLLVINSCISFSIFYSQNVKTLDSLPVNTANGLLTLSESTEFDKTLFDNWEMDFPSLVESLNEIIRKLNNINFDSSFTFEPIYFSGIMTEIKKFFIYVSNKLLKQTHEGTVICLKTMIDFNNYSKILRRIKQIFEYVKTKLTLIDKDKQ